ncbi:hypothetical protein [Nocardioides sp. LML1-1-1.1]|uniref:hypothetical protein n=1 Tax=Nocardioides sp. LML1-1-1.1 TaxID=3135248 RepID=UPI00344A2D90
MIEFLTMRGGPVSNDAFNFFELDRSTRAHMMDELELDIARYAHPYEGVSLTPAGVIAYVGLLRAAIEHGSEMDLIASLSDGSRVTDTPVDAARRLGSTEFNRYYMRAICLRAQAHGTNTVVGHRLRDSNVSRKTSDRLEGMPLSAPKVIENLRARLGQDSETGLGRPNSGMSIRCGCGPCIAVSCGCELCEASSSE